MRTTVLSAIVSTLLLSADACYVRCGAIDVRDVGPNQLVCPGRQTFINSKFGYADIVHFDGGRRSTCVDNEGFDLHEIAENVIGCDNGIPGRCCGNTRC